MDIDELEQNPTSVTDILIPCSLLYKIKKKKEY